MARLPRRATPHGSRDGSVRATTTPDVISRDELASLVTGARAGRRDEWETLYRRALPRLLNYARRRLPSDEHARDAAAETMVRAVASLDRFADEGGGFDAWLYGILRHVVLDAQRRLWREAPVAAPETKGDEPTAVDVVIERDDAAQLRAAFSLLSADDQEILELRIVAGLSSEAVAEVVGRRPGAVRMAQTRALARLRGLLAEGDWHVA